MQFIERTFLTKTLLCNVKHFSNFKFFEVSVNKNNTATVSINHPPINSLSLEVLDEFSNILSDIERNQLSGMVVTSSNDKIFCAGLHLDEFVQLNEKRICNIYSAIQNLWLKLYGAPFVTVAAVNGHAYGSGCLITLGCEYRVMVKDFKIGFPETKSGLTIPPWIQKAMANTFGRPNTELAIISGKLFTTNEAFNTGLVDEIADDKEDALKKAEEFFKRFEKISLTARLLVKQRIRGPDIEKFKKHRQEDLQHFYSFNLLPEVRQNLKFYVDSLKTKKTTNI